MTPRPLLLVLLAGCASQVNQHANTGPDGDYEHAEAVDLVNGAGDTDGVVSYPGGDRVDWKVIQIPAGKFGELAFDLEWSSPRDGLDLGLVIYDGYGKHLGETPHVRHRRNKRTGDKQLTIAKVEETIYVLVYASERRDAGDYELGVKFTDHTPPPPVRLDDVLKGVVIGNPPFLSAVNPPCGDTYDKTNPDCVETPPPCDRDNPDKKNPSCKHLCNKDKLDPENPDCLQFYPECDENAIDKTNPKCKGVVKPPPPPIDGGIVGVSVDDTDTIITIGLGTKQNVTDQWRGEVVGSNGKPIKGGSFKVYLVTSRQCHGRVKLSREKVDANLQVKLYPPE